MSNSEKSCDKLSFQIPPWHIQFRTVKLTFVQFGAASYDEKNNFILRKITEEGIIFYTWVNPAKGLLNPRKNMKLQLDIKILDFCLQKFHIRVHFMHQLRHKQSH